jgi:EAL domain-containing protein (putative c-di-GMP-specific phosphodiesterase class I)
MCSDADSLDGNADLRPLSRLVEGEAKRVLSESQLRANPQLTAQGWERRFVTDIRRADEVMELYRQLGFEVCAEPVAPDDVGDECGDCQLLRIQFRMVYTRSPGKSAGDIDIAAGVNPA